jgi:crossover junction endodeoxyribonuclease RuvC
MAEYFIGIDPGVGGGIAVVGKKGNVVSAVKMPETERDVLDVIRGYGSNAETIGILEHVSASPQMGVVSAFTFGRGYGALRMALTAAGIPFDEVTPQVWQKRLSCRSHGDKNVTKRRAQELFPLVKVTHANADALLIAEYGRRKYLGISPSVDTAKTDGGVLGSTSLF